MEGVLQLLLIARVGQVLVQPHKLGHIGHISILCAVLRQIGHKAELVAGFLRRNRGQVAYHKQGIAL